MNDVIDLADALRRRAQDRPSATAVRIANRVLTYGGLDTRANQVANGLIAMGCTAETRVAILSKNSDLYAEVFAGCLKARSVFLPVNWRLAAPEIAHILTHGAVEALFIEKTFVPVLREVKPLLTRSLGVCVLDGSTDEFPSYEDWSAGMPAHDPLGASAPDRVAVQMYTSGTTGLPKGVQLTEHNFFTFFEIMNQFPWTRYGPHDVAFGPAPFFHVNGLNALLRGLAGGAEVVTVETFDPDVVVDIFERAKVTRAALAPAMIQMCLNVHGVEQRDFSALELIIYGGSPISASVLMKARTVFGCRFAQGYGMTETTGAVCMLTPEDHKDDSKLLSCGRPLPGSEVRVVDSTGHPCPTGEIGEVVVRGEFVTPGYFADEAATKATIVDGWLHTGDAGCFDEAGYLYIRDRIKEMIVSGGENVYPAEVENALLRHPDVIDAAVIGVPDEKWGEAVKAVVVLRPGTDTDEAAILTAVRAWIADYKVPKSIDFVEEIPRNAAGKILRRDLRQPYWEDYERDVN